MDDDELDRLDALAQAATPGVWRVDVMFFDESPERTVEAESACVAEWVDDADAAFIAASRTAIPALIAEIRRLREKVGEDA